MRTHPPRPTLVLALACLLAILLFFIGLAAPQAHLWGSYLLPIVLVFLWGRHDTWRRDIYIVTALASILIVATFWTGGVPAGGNLLTSCLLPILLLWAVAWLLAQRRQLQEQLDAQVRSHTAALGASEAQLNKIFRANPGAIAISRLSDGCYLDANPAYLQMLGYTRDELVGRTSIDLGILSAAARAQIVDHINRQAVAAPFAAQLRTKTGATIDVMTAIDTIDFAGEPCLLTMAADVTAARRLEARANRLAALADAAADAITSAAVDGTILTINRSAEELYKLSAADVIGQNIATIVPPELRDYLRTAMARVGGGEKMADDVAWRRPDGTTRMLSLSLSPVFDSAGRVTALTAIARDVTERKAAERERLFLSALVTSSPESVVGRTVDGTILSWNHGAEQLFGYTAAEAVGQNVTMLAAPGSLTRMQAEMAEIAHGAALEGIETQRMAKDGRVFDCRVSVFPVREAGGEIIGVASFAHDISERKAAERVLRDSEEKFARAFASNPVGIAISRAADGCFLDANPAYQQLVGYSRDELVGRRSTELGILTGAYRAQVLAQEVPHGASASFEAQVHTRGGSTLDVMTVLDTIEAGGETCYLSTVVDITARKRLEDVLQASVERWEMAAEISSIGVWDWRAGSEQVIWDERMYLLHGVAPGTALTFAAWRTLIHPDDRAAVEANSRKSGRERTRIPVEYRVVLPDGSLRYLLSIGGGLYDESGTPVRQLGITMDITAHKRAEVALSESESRLRAVIENTEDSIWSVDAGYCFLVGNSVFVSEAQQQIGRPLVVGDCVLDAPFPPSARAFWQPLYDRAFGGESFTVEMPSGLHPGGTLAIYLNPIYAADGTVAGVTGRATDITARKQMEETLAASERKYRDLYDNSPEMYMSGYPADHLIRECNQTLVRTLGYKREELIGQPISMLYTPTSYSRVLAVVPQYLAAGEYANLEVQLVTKDGTILNVLLSGRLDPATADRPAYSRVTLHDITARKRVEAALAASEAQLRASQARYQMLADYSTDVIWSMDPAGKVSYVSPSSVRQSGFTPEETMCQTLEQTFAPSSRAAVRAAVGDLYGLIRSGQPVPATPNVYEMLRKDGSTYWGETIYSVVYNEQGEFRQIIGATREVTKRVQAERKLGEAYQRVRLAADAAGLGIWNWNFADNSLDWDERMCELYGVPPEQRRAGLYYEIWRARVHPDDRDLADPSGGDPIKSHGSWSSTFRIVLPDGAVRYIQVSAVTEFGPVGQPLRMIGVNRDVTDQKLYEQLLRDANAVLEERVAQRTADLQTALADLQRAGKLKDEFMAMISHELRTPLTGVLSMSELLEDQVAGPLNARQATYVKGITQSGERLLHVINGILGYTHLLSGKVQLQTEPCELAHLLGICAASQQYKAAAKGQSIAVQVTPPDLTITADATALAEVLKRLLDNAVKFTPGGGQIGMEAHLGTAPNAGGTPDSVDLVVWDTGIGIPADQHANIFHAFTQADARLARSHEGIGIGLAYVYEMVHLMGGTMALESMPGEGSRFTISLPAQLRR